MAATKKTSSSTKPNKKAAPKKARLGRGLDALLGTSESFSAKSDATTEQSSDHFTTLPTEWLQRGVYQPRTHMDDKMLDDLAVSIKAQGIVQPILVREISKQRYEIIAGERRWRAAQIAELEEVPVIVRHIEDKSASVIALIENIQREDLSALEEARGLSRLLEEFGLTHQQAAQSIGRSRTSVTNLLRLLALQPGVQDMLEKKMFDMGHARALLSVPEGDQLRAAQAIVREKMSVREAERWVKRFLEPAEVPIKSNTQHHADIVRLEKTLADTLGAKINIRHANGKGKVIIHYHSLDQLDGIIEKMEK